jgi:hypothetical protein
MDKEKNMQSLAHSIRANRWVWSLFIGEIKDLIILSELPLTNYYICRVYNLKDITNYYCS